MVEKSDRRTIFMMTGDLNLEVKQTLAGFRLHLINTNTKYQEAVLKVLEQVIEAVTVEPAKRQRQPQRT
jgi:hypothetical protein